MPSRRLRRSSSSRTARAKPTRRPTGVVRSSSSAGSSRACGSLDRGAGDGQRLGVGEHRAALVEGERAQVEVVDDLRRPGRRGPRPGGPGVGVAGDAERVEHHAGRTGGWSRWWRASKPASASVTRRCRPRRRSSSPAVEQQRPARTAAGRAARAAGSSASARSASTSWARTRSRSSWLAARPNVTTSICSSWRCALGDVAGHQRADGPGLAGAGAGLEQGGAGRAAGRGCRRAGVESTAVRS